MPLQSIESFLRIALPEILCLVDWLTELKPPSPLSRSGRGAVPLGLSFGSSGSSGEEGVGDEGKAIVSQDVLNREVVLLPFQTPDDQQCHNIDF